MKLRVGWCAYIVLSLLGAIFAGCEVSTGEAETTVPPGEPVAAPAPPEAIPEQVGVEGGDVIVATALMKSRPRANVSSFSISTYPTTVAQYRECVGAGACDAPAWKHGGCAPGEAGVNGSTYVQLLSSDGTDELQKKIPVTCVSPSQAQAYCEWVGGRLPRPAEWLSAARGNEVHRFAWGDGKADCNRHWRLAYGIDSSACCAGECTSLENAQLGGTPEAAGFSGMQNVMWTAAEMVGPQPGEALHSCQASAPACLVRGLEPGAIDSIVETSELKGNGEHLGKVEQLAQVPAGFRCVWTEGA